LNFRNARRAREGKEGTDDGHGGGRKCGRRVPPPLLSLSFLLVRRVHAMLVYLP